MRAGPKVGMHIMSSPQQKLKRPITDNMAGRFATGGAYKSAASADDDKSVFSSDEDAPASSPKVTNTSGPAGYETIPRVRGAASGMPVPGRIPVAKAQTAVEAKVWAHTQTHCLTLLTVNTASVYTCTYLRERAVHVCTGHC